MKIKVKKIIKIELIMKAQKIRYYRIQRNVKEKLEQNLNNIKQIKIQNNQVFYLYNYFVINKEIDSYKEIDD